MQDFHAPPRPRDSVSLQLAEGALNRILSTFGPEIDGKPITLAKLESTPMEAMNLAASLLAVRALGDSAELKSLALEIRTRGIENIRQRQHEKLCQEIDKSIEDSQKAQKAGIISVIVDWVVAVAEVVSGVVKIALGDVAGGAMDLAAGCSGFVKALAETIALTCDEETAKKWKEVAEVAGKIQLAFEIAGMCVDVISVGRGVMALKSVAKGTEAVLEKGAGEVLHAAVETGSNKLAKECAVSIGEQVAKNVAEQVAKDVSVPLSRRLLARAVGKEAACEFLKDCTQEALQAALQHAVAKSVAQSVERVAGQAIKKGGEVTVSALTQKVVKEVRRELFDSILKASIRSTANIGKMVTVAGARGANGIAQGVIGKQRAELEKIIQTLAAEGTFMQFILDEFDKLKKRAREDISQLLDASGKALASASDSQLKTGAVLSDIAHKTV
ncbi:MAG: type III secretion system translocon subunit SctE [Burkholderiaceae bacterium]|nr:type III secretion system translocon subunit SctE [Burkholderiaceae bacterium]